MLLMISCLKIVYQFWDVFRLQPYRLCEKMPRKFRYLNLSNISAFNLCGDPIIWTINFRWQIPLQLLSSEFLGCAATVSNCIIFTLLYINVAGLCIANVQYVIHTNTWYFNINFSYLDVCVLFQKYICLL